MISLSIYSACREAGIAVVQTLHTFRLFCPGQLSSGTAIFVKNVIEHGLSRSALGCYRNSRSATAIVEMMLAVHRHLQTWTAGVTCYIALTGGVILPCSIVVREGKNSIF